MPGLLKGGCAARTLWPGYLPSHSKSSPLQKSKTISRSCMPKRKTPNAVGGLVEYPAYFFFLSILAMVFHRTSSNRCKSAGPIDTPSGTNPFFTIFPKTQYGCDQTTVITVPRSILWFLIFTARRSMSLPNASGKRPLTSSTAIAIGPRAVNPATLSDWWCW